MFPGPCCATPSILRFPHSRGDVPGILAAVGALGGFSPLTWGCSGAYVLPSATATGFPHSRGDVPHNGARHAVAAKFSPLTWGCSFASKKSSSGQYVFPTHVGMFRRGNHMGKRTERFPHSRGDVPEHGAVRHQTAPFSPLTWGCSIYDVHYLSPSCVFPTHVGMFRSRSRRRPPSHSFPHSRGDVPLLCRKIREWASFSPLTWGCSVPDGLTASRIAVFPTHVGMFRYFGL